jgi:hypothetical protein
LRHCSECARAVSRTTRRIWFSTSLGHPDDR